MTFEPTGDLLASILSYYDGITERYRVLRERTPDPRVELLLSFLAEHVTNLRRQFAEWRQVSDEGALDAWFQYAPDRSRIGALPELDLDDDSSIDEVIAVTLELLERLIDFCDDACQRAQSSRAEGLFEHLIEQTRQEKRRLARVSQEIREL